MFMHFYQGFWYTTRQLNMILPVQHQFRALDSDIILASTPKSGTIWLKAILFSLLHQSYYYSNITVDHPLLRKNLHELVPFLEFLHMLDMNPDLSAFTSPRLLATHIPFGSLPEFMKDFECKIVYLCRNPKDTYVSLWQFTNNLLPKEIGTTSSLEETFDKFCRGVSMDGPFWDHVLGYYKASLEMPHKVFFLTYEEMKEKPREQLKRLASFLGCPFSEDEEEVDEILRLCSFDNLSKLEVNQNGKLSTGHENKSFFRKGEVGDWVSYLTPDMIERIDRITEEKFHGSDLKL
ncbi:hypothetical protein CDL15_Pgr024196 [Punica granatum]|nr:hypothetical protein CDL15_Pgr024196 [Punica granatum]